MSADHLSVFFIIWCLSQEILNRNVEYAFLWMTETDRKFIVIWYKITSVTDHPSQ